MFYVLPHLGNTANSIRRQFFGDLAHGLKFHNTFHFDTPDHAYTCDSTGNYPDLSHFAAVRRMWMECGEFDDIVMHGTAQAEQATVALLYSETSDIWHDGVGTLGSAKRALYLALRHLQFPVDIVIEPDDFVPAATGAETANAMSAVSRLGYKTLYMTEPHVSDQGARAIAAWVANGGVVFATAGAGLRNETNESSTVFSKLLGVTEHAMRTAATGDIQYIKDDLPFSLPLDTVAWKEQPSQGTSTKMEVIGQQSVFKVEKSCKILSHFATGEAAVTSRDEGHGRAFYVGFLPGLAYVYPAIPRRPADRGATDANMNHFIPTLFNTGARRLIGLAASGRDGNFDPRPVVVSEPLVESGVIRAEGAVVNGTALPLINWSGEPVSITQQALQLRNYCLIERRAGPSGKYIY
jgi:hypothetical protein